MTDYDRPTTGHTLTIAPELRQSPMGYHEAAITYRDRVWVICTEGVGNEVTDENPWNAGGIAYTRQQIINLASTPGRETRELEDWVRMFGARLEGNFHLWKRTLDIARDDLHESECGTLHATPSLKASHERTCPECRDYLDESWKDAAIAADVAAMSQMFDVTVIRL